MWNGGSRELQLLEIERINAAFRPGLLYPFYE
jgi:hypothetical protein